VTDETINVPTARSWRDIPQPVKPRAMSRGGKWRRAMAAIRVTLVVAFITAAVGAALWMVVTLSATSPAPGVAKAGPMKPPELRTTRDGVLDNTWLQRILALPAGVSLMELDLDKLRARVLADTQVITATITRNFPDRLVVAVTERTPVARVRVDASGDPRDLLVARDGVVFAGYGFDRGVFESLPWLDGISLGLDGKNFKPIAGMGTVAQLLADAQFAAAHLYATWQIVSLARLESDREIEVTTKDGSTIIFGATGDYYLQLLRLDTIADRLEMLPGARARIDLSLGREVPLMIEQPAASEATARKAKSTASPATKLSLFPQTQPKSKP
jgi:cell division septal protein FtsQ